MRKRSPHALGSLLEGRRGIGRAVMVAGRACLFAGGLGAESADAQVTRVTARVDGQPRVGAIAAGRLWVLADRDSSRVLIEVDAKAARPTGREVVVAAEDVPADFSFLCPACIRPSLAVAAGSLWAIDPVAGQIVQVDATRAEVIRRIDIAARYLAVGRAGL